MHEAPIPEYDDGDYGYDMAKAEDDPIAKLMSRIPRFNKGSIQIYWDLRVSGLPPPYATIYHIQLCIRDLCGRHDVEYFHYSTMVHVR